MPAGGPITSIAAELRELASLRDAGIITEDEFLEQNSDCFHTESTRADIGGVAFGQDDAPISTDVIGYCFVRSLYLDALIVTGDDAYLAKLHNLGFTFADMTGWVSAAESTYCPG